MPGWTAGVCACLGLYLGRVGLVLRLMPTQGSRGCDRSAARPSDVAPGSLANDMEPVGSVSAPVLPVECLLCVFWAPLHS